jgi:hypothetical protein
MNKKVENIGRRILKEANIPEDENFGSVIAILMVISIILTLIRVIQECNKTQLSTLSSESDVYALYQNEIKTYSMKRGLFNSLRIKRIMRKHMSKEQYSKYSLQLLNALYDNGETVKDDEIVALMETYNA